MLSVLNEFLQWAGLALAFLCIGWLASDLGYGRNRKK